MERAHRAHWPFTVAKRSALVLFGLALACLLAEVALRILRPVSTVSYIYSPSHGARLTPSQNSRFTHGSYIVPITTNSQGFHDVEHSVHKDPSRKRLLLLGDSFVEALHVPMDDGISRQLEKAFARKAMPPIEVINLGISGNGPSQYYRLLLEFGLTYSADIVVVFVTLDNDFMNSAPALSMSPHKTYYRLTADDSLEFQPARATSYSLALKQTLRLSAFFTLLRGSVRTGIFEKWMASLGLASHTDRDSSEIGIPPSLQLYLRDRPKQWEEAYRITTRMVREIVRASREAGSSVAIVTIPGVAAIEDRWVEQMAGCARCLEVEWDYHAPEQAIDGVGRELGVPVLHLRPAFQDQYRRSRTSFSFPHDGHWNSRGHAFAAETIVDWMRAEEMYSSLN